MDVKILASGSRGNCTALKSDDTTILLDAGIGFPKIQRALDFKNPAAACITHEHQDHAKLTTIHELLKRGVDIFMSRETAAALNLPSRHNLHSAFYGEVYKIGNCSVKCFDAYHDAAKPLNFIVSDSRDTLAYVTDTGEISSICKGFCQSVTKLVIEANFLTGELTRANIDTQQKQRILENHLSIDKLAEWLSSEYLPKLTEIHLIHISRRHGNAKAFQSLIAAVVRNPNLKNNVFAY